MANLASAPRWTIGLLAVLALMCPISSSALAQLTQYIAVNPIDVCAGSGRVCAPINNIGFQGQTVLNGGPNAPIGIIDSDSQINISRAIFNAIGIEVAFGPVQQYISAPNAAYANTDYLTLHVENSTDSAGNPILQSPDFLILSQQQQDPPGIWTGTVPTPTSPPDVPVASQATVLNLFFVNAILPQNGGIAQLYGFGWENNNGMAISMNTLLGVPGSLPFRPDTIAHEFGHNLDLDHTTFGAGPDPNGECDTTPFSGCAVNLMTAGGNEAGDLRAEPRSTGEASSPSPGGALYALMAGTAEQLNATQQVPQVLLSNFIMNNLAESMTTASEMPADNATTAVTDNIGANLTALSGSNADPKSKPNTSIFFNVTGPVPGTDRPGETLDGLILTLNNAVQFDPDNRVRFFPPDNRLVADVDYIHGSKRNPDCPDPATECLVISLSPGLPENQNLTFSQGIVRKSLSDRDESDHARDYDEGRRDYDAGKRDHDERKRPVTLSQLAAAGAFITSIFSDGLHIKSALTGPNASGQLTANSQNPIPTETSQIDLSKYTSPPADPANPSGPPLLPCTPVPINTRVAREPGDLHHHPPPLGCPNPSETGISDGDPSQEGGQPRGPSLR